MTNFVNAKGKFLTLGEQGAWVNGQRLIIFV
jgi:hypothetical protein